MTTKEIVEKELKETRELADYISEDFEATIRLQKIKKKTEITLKAIKQIEDIQ